MTEKMEKYWRGIVRHSIQQGLTREKFLRKFGPPTREVMARLFDEERAKTVPQKTIGGA